MVSVSVPRGWPAGVWPPTEPGWQDTASAWLLDQAPPEWRLVSVLRRYPNVLAWLTVHHLDAQLRAARNAWIDLPQDENAPVAQEIREMLAEVGPELARRLRGAQYLQAALDDVRNRPG
jgi:hypothetical protein